MTPDPILGPRFEAALDLMVELHRHDSRKEKKTPTISHLLAVCALVLQDGGGEDEAIAALLHDALEDHPNRIKDEDIRTRFGQAVHDMVTSCTDTPPGFTGGDKPAWRPRKEAYLAHLRQASRQALRVSLADKVHNARDIVTDLRAGGGKVWNRFNEGVEGQLWYYGAILDAMKAAGVTGMLMDEYERALTEMRHLAASG